jgi:hypothetical protein
VGSSPTASADRRHSTRPWCNWQHDWLQPSWSGFKSLGACLGRTFAPRSGSWSNRTTPAPQAGDPGATPGGSTDNTTRSCGLAAKAAPLQGDDRWFESTQDYLGPDTPTGRAARLKPGRLRVRLPLWVLTNNWLGRQPADHPGLEPGMLWVRLPPEPLMNRQALVE